MKKLTPVLVVDRIEPCLDFWVSRLDFEKTVEVPEGDSIGFVILSRGNVEIMYQSRDSVARDMPTTALFPVGSGFWGGCYIEVTDIDDVIGRLEGVEPLIARRTTFYGATEYGVREPGGNVIIFAQHGGGGEESHQV